MPQPLRGIKRWEALFLKKRALPVVKTEIRLWCALRSAMLPSPCRCLSPTGTGSILSASACACVATLRARFGRAFLCHEPFGIHGTVNKEYRSLADIQIKEYNASIKLRCREMHDGIFDRQADGGAMEDISRRAVRLFTAEECSASASELLAFRRWRKKAAFPGRQPSSRRTRRTTLSARPGRSTPALTGKCGGCWNQKKNDRT